MEQIRLNLIPTGPMPTCHASQYDKKREIGLVLFNGTRPLLLTDETLELDVRKSDSHIVTIDVPTPEGTNLAVFETTEQMCAVAGSNECELRIKKAGSDIGSLNFIMEIERSPMENGLQSDSEIRNLATQIAEAATPVVEEIAPPIIRDFLDDDYYEKTETDELIASVNANIAYEHEESHVYTQGDFCIYEGTLYMCTSVQTTGEFIEESWRRVTAMDELKEELTDTDAALRDLIDAKMDKTNPSGTGSFSFNRRAGSTIGQNSVAFGENSVASGNNSFTAGYGHVATNYGAFAEGSGNEARGNCSHAEGRSTKATNNNSHSEGGYTTASGGTSHAEGWQTTSSGVCAHAEGSDTTASGENSHAEGNTTTAEGKAAHAEGNNSQATGNGSHAEGYGTKASGYVSHAEGHSTTASATESHAEGENTTASGQAAHTEGAFTRASGLYSHAEGEHTEANHKDQHVFGSYNIPDDSEAQSHNKGNYIEIVGNGTAAYSKSNARTLDWEGNEMIAGDLTFNGSTSLTAEIDRLDDKIDDLPEPMIFKGTLGTGGTIQSLPAADAAHEGYTYKVITEGTYAGQAAKIGDTFTCCKPEGAPAFTWVLFSQGDTDTDTWRNIKVNGTEVIGSGISSGAVDFIGSENIEIEYESTGNKIKAKTKNLYTKEEVDDLIEETVYDLLPSDTESGPIANFETDLALPLKSMEIEVKAQQEAGTPTPSDPKAISGWSEIGLINARNNLFDISTKTDGRALKWNDGDTFADAKSIISDFITVKEGYKLISNYLAQWCCYDKNKNYLGNILSNALVKTSGADRVDNTIPSGYGICYLRLGYRSALNNDSDMREKTDIMLNIGNSILPFEPYAGTTEVIELGGTYYGGRLLQDKDGHRRFEVTHKAKTKLRDLGYWNYSASGNRFYINNIGDVLQKTDWNKHIGLCDCYTEGRVGNNQGDDLAFGFYNASLYLRDTNYTDVTSWLNAMGDYYITYELATPQTINLPDGEPITTFIGTNNIYADSGDTAVEFKESINQKIASLQALILNT